MPFKVKFTAEKKEKIVLGYINHEYGFRETLRVYNINASSLKTWVRLYKSLGLDGLRPGNRISHYSADIKKNAVLDYLGGDFTKSEVLEKYGIRNEVQLRRWIIKYNSHDTLKASGNGGTIIVTKGRKTTYEERVKITEYCIANNFNYAVTAETFEVSYQQVYGWIRKYKDKGVEGLVDRRGKSKEESELTELDKIRAENKLLKAENRRVELENTFLKKLEEIERRRF